MGSHVQSEEREAGSSTPTDTEASQAVLRMEATCFRYHTTADEPKAAGRKIGRPSSALIVPNLEGNSAKSEAWTEE